jgi:FdhD protein
MTDRPRPGPTGRRSVTQLDARSISTIFDTVVTEEPLEIRLGWTGRAPASIAVVMRTPGHDFELASGFLLAEGVLPLGSSPATVAYCVDRSLRRQQRYNVVTVTLSDPPARLPSRRSTAVSSACGVCGAQSLDEVFSPRDAPLAVSETVPHQLVERLFTRMRAHQPLFERTGASHAAAVFTYDGELVVLREDIGRHNAVDKVIGARVLGTASYGEASVLCASGRVGFDIITKAVAGRIGLVAAVGGASSLALDLAERAGITVCGFVRGGRLVVYTVPERITEVAMPAAAVSGRC